MTQVKRTPGPGKDDWIDMQMRGKMPKGVAVYGWALEEGRADVTSVVKNKKNGSYTFKVKETDPYRKTEYFKKFLKVVSAPEGYVAQITFSKDNKTATIVLIPTMPVC